MDSLNPKEFHSPPAHYYPGYFWVINDRLEDAKLIAQLRDMREHDARSVCLLPEPPEFRPVRFGTEMDRPYLGKAYFDTIRLIVAECERLGMHYWLYDEGGWPSGGAAGRVYVRRPLAFCRKMVIAEEVHIGPDEQYRVPADVLCAAILVADEWKPFLPGQTIQGLTHDTKLRIFFVHPKIDSNAGAAAYVDVLCRAATETFLQLTHERYKKHVGRFFGGVIRFAFTDEPAAQNTRLPRQLTWTADMEEIFKSRKGYDIRSLLPALMAVPSDSENANMTRARIDFYDTWSQLFVERYLLPIRDWCRANGLFSGGHFGGEDEPCGNALYGYGHILRALRAMDLPSVDTIWRQLFPGKRSHPFPKYASSVARQAGHRYVMSESFGVYGNGLTPSEMKWIVDQQYVRGVNLLVMACYPYSTRDHFMPGERPHFGPVNPLWKYMDIFHNYVARLGYLLAQGQAVGSVAVYYDIRSIWAGASFGDKAIRLHESLSAALLESQCDFDYIDDDALADTNNLVERGVLRLGPMEYRTVFVPMTKWMEAAALRRLGTFVENGGTVIAVDGWPSAEGGKLSLLESARSPEKTAGKEIRLGKGRMLSVSAQDAPCYALPLVRLDPPCPGIRVCKRDLDSTRFYFLTNEENKEITIKGIFQEEGPGSICDLEKGRLYALPVESTHEGIVAKLEFSPWGSLAILFGMNSGEPLPSFTAKDLLPLNEGWSLRAVRQYSVGLHDFEVSECDGESIGNVKLGDWKEYLGAPFSGDVVYTISFDCDKDRCARSAQLDLGKVCYACAVSLNGKEAGRRIWKPFSLRLDGLLKEGRNELCVTVTNTLANALLDPQVAARWNSMQGPGWPSSGLYYDAKSREFERDSLPSGLYGPVKIVFG